MENNIYLFEYSDKKWCFDVCSNKIFELSILSFKILSENNNDIKQYMKMLLKFYTLQEIFDALNEIKKLKSLGYICENVSEFVVYDYTNLFNIDIVYFDIYTELVEKTVKKLVSDGFNIHLKENILKEQKQVVQQNVSNTDIEFLIEQLDIFLKNWSDKCN